MSKPELVVKAPLYAPALADLEREFTLHKLWTARDRDAFLREIAPRVRGAVISGFIGFTREEFEALPKLEILACLGNPHSGAVDLAFAKARGVIVTNTPDTIAEAVADLAVGLIIAVMRRICEMDRYVRAGKWLEGPAPPGREVRGKRCGIVGLGRIGRGVARRVEACGMTMCYHGPHQKTDVTWPYYSDLESMAREVDCLVVACPATPATRNLISARVLDALGPEGFFVNVSRGANVDEAALIKALAERRIAGAALDVFQDEPRVPAALLAMEHVVLSPHIGSSTYEVREGRREKLLANLRAYFAGKPVPNPMT